MVSRQSQAMLRRHAVPRRAVCVLMVATFASLTFLAAPGAGPPAAATERVALILSTGSGDADGASIEANQARLNNLEVEFKGADEWKDLSTEQFANYRAIIISDRSEEYDRSLLSRLLPAVNGRVFLVGAEPTDHVGKEPDDPVDDCCSSMHGSEILIRRGVEFVAGVAGRTNLYVAGSTTYSDLGASRPESFRADGLDSSDVVEMVSGDHALTRASETLLPLDSAKLSGWNVSVEAALSRWPDGFSELARAGDAQGPPYIVASDGGVRTAELSLGPGDAAPPQRTTQEFRAVLTDSRERTAIANADVLFEVIAGPNAGAVGSCSPCTTGADGAVSWSYEGQSSGQDTVRAAYDENGNGTYEGSGAESSVPVNWTGVNRPPEAEDKHEKTHMNWPVEVNVMVGSSDPDGGPVTFVEAEDGTHGDVECTVEGVCTYDPGEDFVGDDRFKFTVKDDGGLTASATVDVAVTNQQPVTQGDKIKTTVDVPGSVDVLVNDADPDGDTLSIRSEGPAEHGTVTCETPVCTFVPEAGWSGTTSFTYYAGDGPALSVSAATVEVVVRQPNRPPLATNDVFKVRVVEPAVLRVLDNDTDPEDQEINFVGNGQPGHGTVACQGRTCTYTPEATYIGVDSFTYTIKDPFDAKDTGTVTLGVGVPLPEDLPPQAQADEILTEAGLAAEKDVIDNDDDPNDDELTVVGPTEPSNGTVECGDRVCTYSPDDGFSGVDDFTYAVSDPAGNQDSAMVTVYVAYVEPPRGRDLTITPASSTPGGTTTVKGQGCRSNDEVVIRIDDEPSGRGRSDSGGGFELEVQVPDLDVGRYRLVAQCGPLAQEAPLDIAVVSTAPAAGNSTIAAVLGFFVLIGLVVFQSPSYRPMTARPVAG